MGQAHLTAVGASNQVYGLKCIVGSTAIASSGCMFPLWMWWHRLSPNILLVKTINQNNACPMGRLDDYT